MVSVRYSLRDFLLAENDDAAMEHSECVSDVDATDASQCRGKNRIVGVVFETGMSSVARVARSGRTATTRPE